MDIVGECAVEITLNGFLVVGAEVTGAQEEGVVEGGAFVEERLTTCVVEPSGATPGGRNAFADIALRLDGPIRKARRQVGG